MINIWLWRDHSLILSSGTDRDLGWGLDKPGHRLHVCESWHSIKEHGTWKKHPRMDPKSRRPNSNRIIATGTAGSVDTHTHSFDTLLMGPPQEQFSQYSANTLPAFCLSVKGEQRVLTGSTTGWQATEPGMGSIFSFIYPVRVHLCALHRHLCLLSASLYASVMSVPRTGRGKQAGNNGVQH